ncbi:MAG: hypothetical protein A3I26_03115 [Candidatus Yanofskybacteria bacterium RIFCSPLOWO2_02_FULL_43_10]|uniref:Uncharacterized protein n=2 Tax=Parcubacteria group TaxID=1794811 RepID=A0A1G2RPM9_9BACT|nr:MAG: hypothetical protein A2742_02020 [Candidatus Yanofskybacteria bacterium RIFCSPHIGHO2_01_FULL_43_32]OGN10727.1 MAG: hypothetical protein A3C69_03845 [Candidatus Yanofskybacteria bacterium RIFCSPHIGHO2_02_FULL_43_12]OGN17338.1 MAG: hypothetical protein A3E34_00425 [Candidatus Yanofskybacteria bacterium RIFCSPHIGHO2_12_FULL_43_11]OGN29115.1 MAG: hypothetical protein A3I26_03115 [Candidatus Yanofskybacteria bacterium RIFCSPLOWO2_02_FULL_43_10]OGN34399.1 MAG: hypothetical protein A3G51_03360
MLPSKPNGLKWAGFRFVIYNFFETKKVDICDKARPIGLEERPAGAWAWFCQAPREKKLLPLEQKHSGSEKPVGRAHCL